MDGRVTTMVHLYKHEMLFIHACKLAIEVFFGSLEKIVSEKILLGRKSLSINVKFLKQNKIIYLTP